MLSKKELKRAIGPTALSALMLATSVFTPAALAADSESGDVSGSESSVVDEVTQTYTVSVAGDRGLDLADDELIIEAGGSASVEAEAAIGFRITKVRLNDGTHMETAPVETGQLLLDGKVYRIDVEEGHVALRLTNVQSDMQIYFFAEQDPDYEPANQPFTVTVDGEQNVRIDQTTTNTTRGQDVDAVCFAAPGYEITKVRLEDGTHSATAMIAGKRIILNGKTYVIEEDEGYIKLHLTDIQSDMSVYFYADPIEGWGPDYPGWYPYFPDDWHPGEPGSWVDPTDSDASTLTIDIGGTTGTKVDNSSLTVSYGKSVNIVADSTSSYEITKVRVSNGYYTETASVSDGCIWLGSTKYIIDEDDGVVTVRLTNVQCNMSVYFYTSEYDDEDGHYYEGEFVKDGYYGIKLKGDNYVTFDDDFMTVRKGRNAEITATAKSGYHIVRVRVNYGDYQKTAYVSDGYITIDGTRYSITEDGREVSLYMNDVEDDITVRFYTDYGSEDGDYAITVDGDCGVDIDEYVIYADEDDDVNVVATAEDGYEIEEITLDNGKKSNTADVSSGRITLDGKTYRITTSGDKVTLRLTDISWDMDVYFSTGADEDGISVKTPSSTDHYTVTASKSHVQKGGTVVYTVSPDYGYKLDTVTLKVGSLKGSASADAGEIKVGNKTYKMSLSSSGVLTVTVTNVREAVELSATTTYDGEYALYFRTDVRTPYIEGYGSGLFGPKNTLSRAEAATMLARLTNYDSGLTYPSSGVSDVQSGAWYSNVVNAFYAAGIEKDTGSFRPNVAITRAELAVWMYRLSGSPAVSGSAAAFTDVYSYGYTELNNAVAYGRLRGWIDGYPDGTFRPGNSLIRAEAVKLLNRATSRSLTLKNAPSTFTDVPYTYWAYQDIMSAANYV